MVLKLTDKPKLPNNLSIVSVRTTGNVHADNFGYDRTILVDNGSVILES